MTIFANNFVSNVKIMKLKRKFPFELILFFVFPSVFFTACQSGKSIQRQMFNIQSELFYSLTTPAYPDTVVNIIYLNPVYDSPILPYTTVHRKGVTVVPLIFYNYSKINYNVELGNSSFIQPYHEFLMDALMAQCNRSSCFNLLINDEVVLPDSAMILEVKINKNVTTSRMINKGFFVFIPIGEDFIFNSDTWEVEKPVSLLEISVRLMQNNKCLWERVYSNTKDFPYNKSGIEIPFHAYEICVENMTECLSFATKDIVENISQYLHLLMLAR